MRVLIMVAFVFTMHTSMAQSSAYDDLSTIRNESKKFTDSLISTGIDTVISYYYGSAGCPAVSPLSIIYWRQNNETSIKIYKAKSKLRKKKWLVMLDEHCFTGLLESYSVYFLEKNFNKISGDSILDNAQTYILNYTFEEIYVKTKTRNLKYSISCNSRDSNSERYRLRFIDDFLLSVFRLYVINFS